ncbi:hypothetical protein [Mycobacterium szulgai]|uniref:hypothetical protein n=1 Tax=Mycobacterium szulgai TaxID=1787 RepID=UPI0021F36238|nr:hypothetical protein [Mycobacterium szulgai]MCV7077273.1 hypothetical protein [Mycobacterium szulgai]
MRALQGERGTGLAGEKSRGARLFAIAGARGGGRVGRRHPAGRTSRAGSADVLRCHQPARPGDRVEGVAQALAGDDASALYQIGYSFAPFHCPDCAASYCGEHWSWRTFEDELYSGIEGDCPRGHFHVLAY